jgi:hypothetical protein
MNSDIIFVCINLIVTITFYKGLIVIGIDCTSSYLPIYFSRL